MQTPLTGTKAADDTACLRQCGICCGGTIVALIGVVLAVPFACSTGIIAGSLFFLQPARPPLQGPYALGSLRGRLPAGGDRECGLYVQVTYPMDATKDAFEGQEFPAWRDEVIERVSVAGGFPPCFGAALLGGKEQLDPPGAPLANSEGGWPVVVFSSGVTGALELYQQLCRDVASGGAIVVALEFEDASGLYATGCDGGVIEENTSPSGLNLSEIVEFRRPFLLERSMEYDATMEVLLEAINADVKPSSPILQVLQTGRSDRLSLLSHSFGGTSTWLYSQQRKAENGATPFVGAVYLDLWTEPLTEEEQFVESVAPCVHLTSENWGGHAVFRAQIEAHPTTVLASAMALGSVHQWISDTQFLLRFSIARQLNLIGDGDVAALLSGTVEAVQASLQAFYEPERRTDLNATILSISPEEIVAF